MKFLREGGKLKLPKKFRGYMRGSKIFRTLVLMVKNFGLEAEEGGEKFLCGGTWRWRKFLSSLEGGYGEGEKLF